MRTRRNSALASAVAILAAALALLLHLRSAAAESPVPHPTVANAIQSALADGSTISSLGLHRPNLVRTFYERTSYDQAWTMGNEPRPQILGLIRTIKHKSGFEGLDPEYYHTSEIESRLSAMLYNKWRGIKEPLARMAEFELLLSDAFFSYGADLLTGKVKPEMLEEKWGGAEFGLDLPRHLERVLKLNRVEEALQGMAPLHPGYLKLRKELSRLRQIESSGGWPTVRYTSKPGATGIGVKQLARRLAASGDYALSGAPTDTFDSALENEVKRFQRLHGLNPDAIVGPGTLAALNVPVSERIRMIELNMERWRWIPNRSSERYILVNLTDYNLQLMENAQPAMQMRIIIGDKYTNTPVFGATMSYIVLNPSWNIPMKIAFNEIVPKAIEDPDYMNRNRISVYNNAGYKGARYDPATIRWEALTADNFKFWLKQESGPGNPLGPVKFIIPNGEGIYLHGTPGMELFNHAVRTFSHGCIRLEDPMRLALKLLEGSEDWTAARVEKTIASGRETSVPLPRPIRVELVYWTAWVDEDGALHFRDDVYGHDASLAKVFFTK